MRSQPKLYRLIHYLFLITILGCGKRNQNWESELESLSGKFPGKSYDRVFELSRANVKHLAAWGFMPTTIAFVQRLNTPNLNSNIHVSVWILSIGSPLHDEWQLSINGRQSVSREVVDKTQKAIHENTSLRFMEINFQLPSDIFDSLRTANMPEGSIFVSNGRDRTWKIDLGGEMEKIRDIWAMAIEQKRNSVNYYKPLQSGEFEPVRSSGTGKPTPPEQ